MMKNWKHLPPPIPVPYSSRGLETSQQLNAVTRTVVWCTITPGRPTPSRADIEMTRVIIDVAKPLGIAVHDHIIVGKDGHASLKGLKLI